MQKNRMRQALVVGAGPAGLMAAEMLADAGHNVDIYEAMPSPGRKFLRAGVGGLNLTHAENFGAFRQRYTPQEMLDCWLQSFNADDVRAWAQALGVTTFTGSSGRVFPVEKKAAPLLRAWLKRLKEKGVKLHTRHYWTGLEQLPQKNAVRHQFRTGQGLVECQAAVSVLAMGGGSWSRLGSDGRWLSILADRGVQVGELKPSNCGFEYPWSEYFRKRFAGLPLKAVSLTVEAGGESFSRQGEVMITRYGLEGSLVYQASRLIRTVLEKKGDARIIWDLLPGRDETALQKALSVPIGKQTLSNYLRKRTGLSAIKFALLYELTAGNPPLSTYSNSELARNLKALPQVLTASRPIDEAISTVGGVCEQSLTPELMLKQLPGVFCAGEMIDWDAPTGGYLLTACLAAGKVSGLAAAAYLEKSDLQ